MAFDSNGLHSRVHNWVDDAGNAINITASRMDAEFDDVSTALNSLSDQVQDGSATYIAAGGTADVITLTFSPAVTAYVTGQPLRFKALGANTGPVTVNVNGLGAKAVKKDVSVALIANEIPSGAIITVVYDGANFQVVSGLAEETVETGITAGTTQTQAGATAMTASINDVETVANVNDGVKLPTAVPGLVRYVSNNGANSMRVYPNTSDTVNGGSVNVHVDQAAGNKTMYVAMTTTNWEAF